MGIIKGKLSNLSKYDIKKTLQYIKTLSDKPIFTGIEELYILEKELLRFFTIVVCFDNYLSYDKNQLILNNINIYYKNNKRILYIIQKYNLGDLFMIIDTNYRICNNIFYDYLYDIFIYHIDNFYIEKEYYGEIVIKENKFLLHVFRGKDEWHNSNNSLLFELSDNGEKFFGFSIFFGKNEIFIGNLQYTNKYFLKYKGMKKMRLHKYAFYFLKLLSEKLGKKNLLSYSNENYSNGIKQFCQIYNDIYEAIGMKKNEKGFYYGIINNLDIRHRDNKTFLTSIEKILPLIKI